jgi:RNA polymerase sigma-70 factor (ECF subfamily)
MRQLKEIDKEIIKRCQNGENDSFEIIYNHYKDYVYTLIYRTVGNREDAEDLQQEVFLKIFQNIKNFRFKSSFTTYIFQIVHNLCIDNVYRKKRIFKRDISEIKNDFKIDLKGDIEKVLNSIEPKYRMCVILRDIEGFSYKEISKILKISEGTVKSRINRGREKLRKKLKDLRGE